MAKVDYTGRRFGKLFIVGEIPMAERAVVGNRWSYVCDCGKTGEVSTGHLNFGTKSCGCLVSEVNGNRLRKHGRSRGDKMYKLWSSIKERCERKAHFAYPSYGGRGIKMCAEWMASFEAFEKHVGVRPSESHTIDRIDNNKGYEPNNVRWATMVEQNNNRRSTLVINYLGITMTASGWAALLGFQRNLISSRLKIGWTLTEALTTRPMRNTPSSSFVQLPVDGEAVRV